MAYIQKANVILEVKNSEVQRMLDMGYNLLDENGNVAEVGKPQDLESYKRLYFEQLETIKALKEKLAEYEKAPVKEPKKSSKSTK